MGQKALQKLFSKPMSRRDFLAHLGAGVLVLTGMSGLLKSLVDYRPRHSKMPGGYGSSSYGGK